MSSCLLFFNPIPCFEPAVRLDLDHCQTLSKEPLLPAAPDRRFVGSHDPAVTLIAARLTEVRPGCTAQLTFTGSWGGLMALAAGEADLAGSHLWDEESDSYNVPFVQRLLLGQRVALLTLAYRPLGLIVSPTNPHWLSDL